MCRYAGKTLESIWLLPLRNPEGQVVEAIALLFRPRYIVIRVGVGLGLGLWIDADGGGGGVLSTVGRASAAVRFLTSSAVVSSDVCKALAKAALSKAASA